MASLKDTLIQGSARVTDTLYTTTAQLTSLLAPTAAGGTTFGPGTNGQVLKSNGTSIYWTSDIDDKIDAISTSTLRDVPFGVGTSDWTASGGNYIATVSSTYVTATSREWVTFNDTFRSYAKGDISVDKVSGGGGITLTTSAVPSGTIQGVLYIIDTDDGKVPVLIEGTVTPIENGGTGQSTLSGAQNALGITNLSSRVDGKLDKTGGIITGNINQRNNGIDASKADNGVSSTQWPTTMNITDKDGRILTRMEGVVDPNGNISAYWYARNYNTSGQQVAQKGIRISMNKSGVMTYTVDEGNKFRSAIGAAGTSVSYSITLSSSLWDTDQTYIIAGLSGITADSNIVTGIAANATAEQYDIASQAQIRCIAQGSGVLQFKYFGTKPEVNIPVTVIIIG